MKRSILVVAGLAVMGAANAQLWVNAHNAVTYQGVWDAAGAGSGGANASVLNSAAGGPGTTTYGYGSALSASVALSDDFTLGAGGGVATGIRVYAYQTGATSPTLTGVQVNIFEGGTGGGVGGTNVYNSGGLIATANPVFVAYRTLTTDVATATTRRIYAYDIMFNSGVNLNAGQHWLTFTTAGSLASGPWVAPIVPFTGTGNSFQSLNGGTTWAPTVNGTAVGSDELPFVVYGQAVPEPATMTILGLGALAAWRRRNKK